jgi:hypothetical protein
MSFQRTPYSELRACVVSHKLESSINMARQCRAIDRAGEIIMRVVAGIAQASAQKG